MSKFTLGPWRYQIEGKHMADYGHKIMAGEDDCVAYVSPMNLTPGAREANARLIAAAPSMLEALELVREALGDAETPLMAIVCTAIKQATGGGK